MQVLKLAEIARDVAIREGQNADSWNEWFEDLCEEYEQIKKELNDEE